MTMSSILTVIATAAAVFSLHCAQNAVGLKRPRRGRQAALPPLALLLAIAAVITLCILRDKLNEFLAMIPLGSLGSLGSIFSRFIDASVTILNPALILCFIPVKTIILPIISKLWSRDDLMNLTSSGFYEYDKDHNEWFLADKWVGLRELVKWFFYGGAALAGIYLGIVAEMGAESAATHFFFPCAAVIVVCECYGFLNGRTKEEFEHDVAGDDADARRVGNYYKLREVLEKLFAPQMLASHTGCEYVGKSSATEMLARLEASPDVADRVTAEYFKLRDNDTFPDADHIAATSMLMHGKNIVFMNPFYRDLTQYIILPLTDALIAGKKCLVVAGRTASAPDIAAWLEQSLSSYNRMNDLWKVGTLSGNSAECDIGILSYSHLYEASALAGNLDFLRSAGFVLLVEPSLIVGTGQVGLSLIAGEMQTSSPTYCVCDRPAEGLVDTLSHLLRAEFTEVVASPVPRCIYTGMAWNADGDYLRQSLFDKQTRYLGNGLELAAVAVKNQIPKVTWYSETKAPVRDLKWISGQFYPTICRYMNLPGMQSSLYDKIEFLSNPWDAPVADERFIIAEDEFCNLFSTMRSYLSRGSGQAFVNVLSESYLLRDYMRCNRMMFMSDLGAIPSLVAGYAKTERNTLMKLLLLMSYRPVTEQEIRNEFRLVSLACDDVFYTFTRILYKYTGLGDSILTVRSIQSDDDVLSASSSCSFSIEPTVFYEHFSHSLSNAHFLLEDEKSDFINAKMFGHVLQSILPGQFVVFDGKYYLVRFISPGGGVVLRRASDLYDGRKYYRQLRTYTIEESPEDEVLARRIIMDIEVTLLRCGFSADTNGYLELNSNHDLRTARMVDLSLDPSTPTYTRRYKNKVLLRLKFPGINERVRFSICMLLGELFRSVFPDMWHYLAVTARQPDEVSGILKNIVYGIGGAVEDEYIYIIEDSETDLGLIEAVEANLMRFMEIISDFLDWHFEKMREPASKDPLPADVTMPADIKKRNMFLKMARRIAVLFGGAKEEPVVIPRPSEVKPKPAPPKEQKPDTAQPQKKPKPRPEDQIQSESEQDPDLVHVDGTDIFDNEGAPEDNELLEIQFAEIGLVPLDKSRYQKDCFLKFGYEDIDARIQVEDVRRYLRLHGWSSNSLTKARRRDVADKTLDVGVVNHCDFCAMPLSGVSYEKLNDGRIRCNDCSASAIATVAEFRELFYQALDLMEIIFGVRIKVPVNVSMRDARYVGRSSGILFKPSAGVAERVLGYAQRKGGKYNLVIENGSPRLAALMTMVHELTHIWQYLNWNDAEIRRIYGKGSNRDIVYEGMAVWASIQYLYSIGETYFAAQQEYKMSQREDIYGVGYMLYRERYPLTTDSSLLKFSPFESFPPL